MFRISKINFLIAKFNIQSITSIVIDRKNSIFFYFLSTSFAGKIKKLFFKPSRNTKI